MELIISLTIKVGYGNAKCMVPVICLILFMFIYINRRVGLGVKLKIALHDAIATKS